MMFIRALLIYLADTDESVLIFTISALEIYQLNTHKSIKLSITLLPIAGLVLLLGSVQES